MSAATPLGSLPHVVADVMSRPVLTVEIEETLWDAWQLLFVSGLRHLVVLDADGQCLGVLSDRSILADLPVTQEHLSLRKVSDVLARVPLATVSPGDDTAQAARVMVANSVEALPVIDSTKRLVGILTEADIVRWLAD